MRRSMPVSGCYHGKTKKLEGDYIVTQNILGSSINEVKMAVSVTQPQKQFAVKRIKRTSILSYLFGTSDVDSFSEVENYLCFDHPHITKLHDVYETQQHFHLVMECMEGGDLCTRLEEKGKFSEMEASKAIRQMLQALEYLHKEGFAHRDVKLENFLYDTKNGSHLKLADFGFTSSKAKMKDCVGTLSYAAPEVIKCRHGSKNCSYTKQCDMWSMGVLGFLLLADTMPFAGDEASQMRQIRQGSFNMQPEGWRNLSAEGKDFIQALLLIDPSKRLTAEKALEHPWITQHQGKDHYSASESSEETTVESDSLKGSSPSLSSATTSNNNFDGCVSI